MMFGKKLKALEAALNERIDDILSRLESLKNYIYKRDSISTEERIYRYSGYLESDLGFLRDFEVDDRILYSIEHDIIEVSCFIKVYDVPSELVSLLEKTAVKCRDIYLAKFESEPVCYSHWMKTVEDYKKKK